MNTLAQPAVTTPDPPLPPDARYFRMLAAHREAEKLAAARGLPPEPFVWPPAAA
jgi:hypothetical protein